MAAKPITPQEAEQKSNNSIPDFVIEAVNNCIARNLFEGTARIDQAEIEKEIKKLRPKGIKWNDKWLDFESLFRASGWSVSYDKPGYCEDYEPFFIFKKKRK